MTALDRLRPAAAAVLWSAAAVCLAEVPAGLKPYVSEDAPALVLLHVRVIDGTGAAAADDQRIDIEAGKITRIQSAKFRSAYPPNAKVLDLSGRNVIPRLVGMHEHLFYPGPETGPDGLPFSIEMIDSGPRLYLASGVTTARTAGGMEPYTDLSLKILIDKGATHGPNLRITGPYIGGLPGFLPQFRTLADAEDAGRTVDYWAAEGVTSFKAFMGIKSEELKVAAQDIENIENVQLVFKDGVGFDPVKLTQSVRGLVGLR
jgi:imidazolonepropionase-like amidohydrolase